MMEIQKKKEREKSNDDLFSQVEEEIVEELIRVVRPTFSNLT